MYEPKTLTEAIRYYSDEQTCIDVVAQLRWPDGKPVCPKCGVVEDERKHYWLNTQKRWKCFSCRKQFSVKVNSIFEDSALKLSDWLTGLWMLVNCKNGVSSYELSRATGMAQKSAWFVLQRLRYILKAVDQRPMGSPGVVEVDEYYHGPDPKMMHLDRRRKLKTFDNGYTSKTTVMGLLDRKTREVRAMVVPNATRVVLQGEILKHCGFATKVYTDGWSGYDHMDAKRFIHKIVDHSKQYVAKGGVSTQGIENFWSCLARTLTGTYIAVEPYHLDLYLNEQCYRYTNRKGMNDGARFRKALSMIGDRRLTWNRLTGKEGA
jgi:transposase-like protein